MMDFLTERNISKETINDIISNNSASLVFDVSCNSQECLKIIECMERLGIKCIDNLLISYLNVFLMDYEDFIKKIAKLNVAHFVECLNNDICAIEFIY